MKYVAHDTETTLIGKDNVVPDLICSGFYDLAVKKPEVVHWSPKDEHIARIKALYDSEDHIIYQNASFDLAVLSKYDWDLLPLIWKALDEGRVHDTMLREMLLNLTLSGSIDIIEQYGIKKQMYYSLAELAMQYLQIDLSEEKDAEDSVRLNYAMVQHKPLSEWPKEFIKYAGEDPEYTGIIFLEQEKRREECIENTGYDPFAKESHVVATSLALQFMTAQGNKMDKERVLAVTEEFLTLYNDPDLVWPLVHSSVIRDFRSARPDIKPSKLIDAAKEAWQDAGEEDCKKYAGTGLVIPAVPPQPYANGAKVHTETCEGHKDHPDFKKGTKIKHCLCPLKMKKAAPEKGSDINVHQYIWDIARADPNIEVWLSKGFKEKLKEAGIDVPHPISREMLEANETVPFVEFSDEPKPKRMSLRVDKEWLATYAALDPVLAKYDERHKVQKIVTSYLPCLYWADQYKTGCPLLMEGETDKFAGKTPADRVHAQFASLKETGRTSSYAAKKGKGNSAIVLFPSWNIQQVDPRIRQCVIPDEGNVLFSIDYSAMELGTAAQISYNLLGHKGVLMGLINAGKDTHSYLGAQIARALDPDFTKAWGLDPDDPDKSYDLFMAVKKNKENCDSPIFRDIFDEVYLGKKWGDHVVNWEDCTMAQYYKHFRTLGKPTGLGFWGGLGEPTFVSMVRASYGANVDIETAKVLRQIWRTYIPEGQEFLNYVNKHMVDKWATPETVVDAHGKHKKRQFYCYDTPMGMHRAKCSYTAAANGAALQSPSAEGATLATINIMKKCTVGSLAGYVFPSGFIHDEVFGEIVMNEYTTPRIKQMQDIMVRDMETITPDVRASTEATIMSRWSKFAETDTDENGNLVVWEPEQ